MLEAYPGSRVANVKGLSISVHGLDVTMDMSAQLASQTPGATVLWLVKPACYVIFSKQAADHPDRQPGPLEQSACRDWLLLNRKQTLDERNELPAKGLQGCSMEQSFSLPPAGSRPQALCQNSFQAGGGLFQTRHHGAHRYRRGPNQGPCGHQEGEGREAR